MELPYSLSELQSICDDIHIIFTRHSRRRCAERGITLDDIEKTIMTGKIIEAYADDKPFPSCLISGTDNKQIHIHVVLSSDKQFIYIITAYRPDDDKWTDNYTVRKRGNE